MVSGIIREEEKVKKNISARAWNYSYDQDNFCWNVMEASYVLGTLPTALMPEFIDLYISVR